MLLIHPQPQMPPKRQGLWEQQQQCWLLDEEQLLLQRLCQALPQMQVKHNPRICPGTHLMRIISVSGFDALLVVARLLCVNTLPVREAREQNRAR